MTPRSTSSVRWAARYAVFDELWRGRARVIVDPVLEAVLRDGGPGVAHGSDPALAELVDDLVPVEPIDGEPVWMAVATVEVAVELGASRPGTTFVPLPAIADVVGRAHWDVALVDLSADLDPRTRGGAGDRAASALDQLGIDGGRGRVVVLSVPVRDYPRSEHGLDYDEMATLVVEQLGGGRLYGLYAPPMIAVVEFGDLDDDAEEDFVDDDLEDDDLEDDEEHTSDLGPVEDDQVYDEEFEDDDDVPLTYDNTLGSQEPQLLEYIAIAGAEPPIEGLALVELPVLDGDDDGGARTQLAQARRQADLSAIDRQTQLERAEALERDNVELRRQIDELREQLAGAARPAPDLATEVALQAALAREQALRWRVGELEDALSTAMARPVGELEAEVAELRERMRVNGGAEPATRAPETAVAPSSSIGPAAALRPAFVAPVRVRLEALVRRIERGGIGTLELRRELVALIRRLQPVRA